MRATDFPESNDTREVIAAFERWVLQLGRPSVVASKLPVNLPTKPIPDKTDFFSVVVLRNITIEQAKDAQLLVGTASAAKSWGGPTSYRWPTTCSTPTFLVTQSSDEGGYTLAFPLIYMPESDIKLILQQASNASHLAHYQKLGLDTKEIELHTFQFTAERKWELINGVPKGIHK